MGASIERIFTDEDRAEGRHREEMRLALAEGRAGDERWHRRKAGSRFWASGEMTLLRGADGAPEGFAKIVRDQTRQRDAFERLRRSQDRFRALVETMETAFAIVEVKFDAEDRPVDYRFLEANPAFERQAGVNLRGKWVTEFAPDLERFWFETYGRVAWTGEPANFENYANTFERWFDVRAIRVGDPAERQIAIFFNDVTARKCAEERLHRLNETLEQQIQERTLELNTLWDTSPDLLLVLDFKGVFRRVNPAWTKMLGYRPDELVGRHVNEFVVAADHAETVEATILAAEGASRGSSTATATRTAPYAGSPGWRRLRVRSPTRSAATSPPSGRRPRCWRRPRRRCGNRRRWRRSASSPAASPTTSTISSPASPARSS
ncbi:PAS domain S-box protein [Methylorubrum suomiense]